MAPPPTEASPLCEDPSKRASGNWLATLRLVGTSGAGLLADGYDLQVVNLVLAIMEHIYPQKMDPRAKSFAASMTLAGVVVGQVTFGALADVFGRKLTSITTAMLTILGAALSACVADSPAMGIATQLGLCRLLLGLGIGGEYPLSAAIGKEAEGRALALTRPQLLVANMLLFNLGSVIQAAFVGIMLAASVPLDLTWRLALAGGVVPSLVAVVLRLMMEEPEARSREAQHMPTEVTPSYLANLRAKVRSKWILLFGACLSWFLFNFTAYGQGAFASIICDRLLGGAGDTDLEMAKRNMVFALIMGGVNLLATFIGLFILSVPLRAMQAGAFFLMAVPMWLVAVLYGHSDSSGWLASIYMFSVFMMPFVGITTYMVPTENFPASIRGTCMGIASASGKIGGMVGTAVFPIWEHRYSLNMVLVVSGFVSLLGAFVTLALTPVTRTSEECETEKEV